MNSHPSAHLPLNSLCCVKPGFQTPPAAITLTEKEGLSPTSAEVNSTWQAAGNHPNFLFSFWCPGENRVREWALEIPNAQLNSDFTPQGPLCEKEGTALLSHAVSLVILSPGG